MTEIEPALTGWTTEEIARQFRLEVQQLFAAENEAHLRQEREEIALIKDRLVAEGKPLPDWLVERDSFLWEIYSGSEIRIDRNKVTVVAPIGFAIGTNFVEMFGDTSVGWTLPALFAVLVDGEPHVSVELLLIDYWDDVRHATWNAEREDATRKVSETEVAIDPTTAAIAEQTIERDRLRSEVKRLTEGVDTVFEKGYDQAVQEIRDHFAGRGDVVAEIDKIWKIFLKRRIQIP